MKSSSLLFLVPNNNSMKVWQEIPFKKWVNIDNFLCGKGYFNSLIYCIRFNVVLF